MYCSKCGNNVDPSSRFCPACGTAIPVAPPPPGYSPNSGQLFRPLTGRMIGGVCAAFALRYGWDVTVTRVITALLIVCTGVGILAYIAAWIIIPEEPYPIATKSI
jgi:phage shock protein PspC (stress-responsive transcriptional regulator)